jgi:glycosyltransferase involved in cell wall biosynthesis
MDAPSQMSESLVSVCLPVYNGARYLAESIESVLAQTHTNLELLIADDGSTDDTADLCMKYAQRDKRIKFWRNETNLGLFANYNRCMESARGTFIKPFAQDDILHNEMLAKAVEVFQFNQDVSLISVGRRWIDETGADISRQVTSPRATKYVPPDRPIPGSVVIRKALSPVTNFIGEPVSVIFRADAKGTGFDEDLSHIGDLEYWLRLLKQGSFYFKSDVLCSYRSHPNSQTRKNWHDFMIASDFLKIGSKCAWALDEVGICKEEFEAQNIRSAAIGAGCLWDGKKLDVVPMGDPSTADINASPRERVLLQVIAGLQRVQSQSLNAMPPQATLSNPYSKNADAIRVLERKLVLMLSSKSWTWTKPLRDANKVLGGSVSTVPQFDARLKLQDIDEQRAYITYLRKLIGAVRCSKSWRVSAPIRVLTD